MPLIHSKSKKALKENIKTEMEAHPSKEKRAQDLAIAYSVQRQAKKKKMAHGGEVKSDSPGQPVKMSSEHGMREEHEHSANPPKTHGKMTHEGPEQHSKNDSVGQSIGLEPSSHMLEDDSIPHSMAEAIMMKRKERKMMAEGGMVDLDSNAEEQPNSFYHQNEEEAMDLDLDATMDDVSEPEDSNEHSVELEDEDSHDMVSKIMKKKSKK